MGNETFLLSTSSPSKPRAGTSESGRRGPLLLTAQNSIPLFWYMLFDRESIIPSEGAAESGAALKYHALSTPTEQGLSLARSRWPRVRLVLGTGTDPLFELWSAFLGEHASPYIHCETWEWSWLFPSTRAFRSHLRTCVEAFDHVPSVRKGRPRLNEWWRELLGQCESVDGVDHIHPLGDFSYCGVTSRPRDELGPRTIRRLISRRSGRPSSTAAVLRSNLHLAV